MRKIISALLKPGRKLGLDEPETRRERNREEREAPITIPVSMSQTALRVLITLSIVVTALAVIQSIDEWKAEDNYTTKFGATFAIATLGNLSGMAPGAILLLPLLTYLASLTGGMSVGAFQVGYNFVDRVFGQKAMVDKATAEGKTEGIAIGDAQGYDRGKNEGIALGIAQERERWMRKQGRGSEPDA